MGWHSKWWHTPMFSKNNVTDYRCDIVKITSSFRIFSLPCFFWVKVCPIFWDDFQPSLHKHFTSPLTRSVPLGSCGYREALTPRNQECRWVVGTSRPIPQAMCVPFWRFGMFWPENPIKYMEMLGIGNLFPLIFGSDLEPCLLFMATCVCLPGLPWT